MSKQLMMDALTLQHDIGSITGKPVTPLACAEILECTSTLHRYFAQQQANLPSRSRSVGAQTAMDCLNRMQAACKELDGQVMIDQGQLKIAFLINSNEYHPINVPGWKQAQERVKEAIEAGLEEVTVPPPASESDTKGKKSGK